MGGEPRIDGTRVSVRQIAELVDLRKMPVPDVRRRLKVPEVDIHRSMVYYHDHPEEFAALRQERAEAERRGKKNAITPPDGDEPLNSVGD